MPDKRKKNKRMGGTIRIGHRVVVVRDVYRLEEFAAYRDREMGLYAAEGLEGLVIDEFLSYKGSHHRCPNVQVWIKETYEIKTLKKNQVRRIRTLCHIQK